MYLEEIDFTTLCDQDDLDVITSANYDKRDKALKMAMSEVRTYTRTKYRIDQEFAKTGTARNDYLMMIVMDLTLYHLFCILASRMGIEMRKTRYDDAILWLKDVRSGKNDPGIPTIDDPISTGTDPTSDPERYDQLRYGSMEKSDPNW